jgi:preprotein translocase subunit SecD
MMFRNTLKWLWIWCLLTLTGAVYGNTEKAVLIEILDKKVLYAGQEVALEELQEQLKEISTDRPVLLLVDGQTRFEWMTAVLEPLQQRSYSISIQPRESYLLSISRIHEQAGEHTRDIKRLRDGAVLHVDRKPVITANDLNRVTVVEENGRYSVVLEFSEDGAMKMEELTKEWAQKRLAFVVCGELVGDPLILHPVSGRQHQIAGLSEEQAKRLVRAIK